MRPAGTRRHKVRIEAPVTTRNAMGEAVQSSWTVLGRRRASVRQVVYQELNERQQVVGEAGYELVFPYIAGLDSTCRIVWESGGGKVLWPSSVITEERDEHTVQATEKAV